MFTPTQCAVIFDLDGVIVDSSQQHFESFVALGKEVGYAMDRARFANIFGRRNEEIFPMLLGPQLSREEVQHLADRKEELFRDRIRGQVEPLPGVTELLPALKAAGFHLAIGSSTPPKNIELILTELGFKAYFLAIVSGDDVSKGKPDPEVFVTAANRLGVPPAQAVVIEDAVAGVEAAKNGGMHALGVTTNHPRESLHKADRVVDSLAEVAPADFLALINGVAVP